MRFSFPFSRKYLPALASVFVLFSLSFMLSGCFGKQKVADPVKSFADAEKAEKAKRFDEAFNLYMAVANSVSDERGAEAMFRAAKIQGEKPKERMAAWTLTRSLIKKYKNSGYPIVKEAQILEKNLAEKIDKQNSNEPLYKFLDSLVALTGRKSYSYWVAVLLITFLVKVITWPMQHMQLKAMKQMQAVQPLIKELQKKYKDNQQELTKKVMELYKEHKVNPFASCLPLLIQMPILYFLYKTIQLYQFQFNNGTFLWIGSSLSKLTPLIASSLAERDIPLVVIYTVSMYVTQKLTPVDPTQADQQKMMSIMMPLMFGYLFGVLYEFPSAFMLYWLVFNIIQIVQQYYALRKPAPVAVAVQPAENEPTARRPRPRKRR